MDVNQVKANVCILHTRSMCAPSKPIQTVKQTHDNKRGDAIERNNDKEMCHALIMRSFRTLC